MPDILVRPGAARAAATVRSRPLPPEERPDLPALERVTVRTWGSAPGLALLLAVPIITVVWSGVRYAAQISALLEVQGVFGPVGRSLGLSVVALVCVLIWTLVRLSKGDFAWSTDKGPPHFS